MLLSKTLHSSTLKLALIYVAVFCAAIFAVLGYVYWITAGYLAQDIENSLGAERSLLLDTYRKAGRDELATRIGERVQDPHFQNWVYLLVDVSGHEVAGNLPAWPKEPKNIQGSMISGCRMMGRARRRLFRCARKTPPSRTAPGCSLDAR